MYDASAGGKNGSSAVAYPPSSTVLFFSSNIRIAIPGKLLLTLSLERQTLARLVYDYSKGEPFLV